MTSDVLNLYRRLSRLPAGRWLFTRAVCFQAPYFGSIRPLFRELRPGHCSVSMKKRRAVQNHLGGVHALAMGNLCELAAGLVTEVTLQDDMRWIPRGMNIQYVGQARSNVTAEAFIEQRIYTEKENITVEVKVKDDQEKTIVTADITMYLSPRS